MNQGKRFFYIFYAESAKICLKHHFLKTSSLINLYISFYMNFGKHAAIYKVSM